MKKFILPKIYSHCFITGKGPSSADKYHKSPAKDGRKALSKPAPSSRPPAPPGRTLATANKGQAPVRGKAQPPPPPGGSRRDPQPRSNQVYI